MFSNFKRDFISILEGLIISSDTEIIHADIQVCVCVCEVQIMLVLVIGFGNNYNSFS